jgi:uncharacterized cupin superfamily protein
VTAPPPRPPALDPAALPGENRTDYPEPYRALVAGRFRRPLGDVLGLTRFGVNLTRLEPGSATAQRHWHSHWHSRGDELVYVLEGELTLVTDGGEQLLTPGMCAGFRGGVPDDEGTYSDIDLRYAKDGR